MKYFLGAATAALLLAAATAASAATIQTTASVTATATVISPLTETVAHQMGFGKLVVNGGVAGTLILGTNGNRSVSGGVNLVGGTSGTAAEVDFVGDTTNGAPNPYDVQVDASTSLTGPSGSTPMNVTITTSTSPGTGLTGLTGSQAITIGGTLSVAGNQAAGAYSGTFNVTGNYE